MGAEVAGPHKSQAQHEAKDDVTDQRDQHSGRREPEHQFFAMRSQRHEGDQARPHGEHREADSSHHHPAGPRTPVQTDHQCDDIEADSSARGIAEVAPQITDRGTRGAGITDDQPSQLRDKVTHHVTQMHCAQPEYVIRHARDHPYDEGMSDEGIAGMGPHKHQHQQRKPERDNDQR
jgi:hypothetical protein